MSAVTDEQGREVVLSRLFDLTWDLRPFIETKSTIQNERIINWPKDIPAELREDIQAAVYVWWQQGLKTYQRPKATTIAGAVRSSVPLLRYLAAQGVVSVSDVKPSMLRDFSASLPETTKISRSASYLRFQIVNILYEFAGHLAKPMNEHPWEGVFFDTFVKRSNSISTATDFTSKTPVIPPSVQRALFNHAERICASAGTILDERDKGQRAPRSEEVTQIRDALLYLTMSCSGMRFSEAVGMQNGCWRTEQIDGVEYHWIRTTEHKSGAGVVDYLVPPELLRLLPLLERFAEPFQQRMREEMKHLESVLANETGPRKSAANRIRLNELRACVDRLFIGISSKHGGDLSSDRSRLDVLSTRAGWYQMRRFALTAGVTNWKLANHQCRRTFAWNIARSRLGKFGLVFLKWQLKHVSMSLTQLYAANPMQDASMYAEFVDELIAARSEVIASWLEDDSKLSGGAGKRVEIFRATPIRNRQSLLRSTSENVNIRSNGHAWCLSEQAGCGGEGLYDAVICSDCSDAVIDKDFVDVWQQIHLQGHELTRLAAGDSHMISQAARSVAKSAKVLADLNVPLPSDEQIQRYFDELQGKMILPPI